MAKISQKNHSNNYSVTNKESPPWSKEHPISIDSCTIRIPAELVEFKDESLFGSNYALVNKLTGEEIAEYQKRDEKKIDLHKKMIVRYRYGKGRYGDNARFSYYLFIDFTSKALKENYMEGVHSDSVRQLYKELVSHNVVSFSYDDFMVKSACTDVDLKRDLYWENDISFSEYVKQLEHNVKPSRKKDAGCRRFNQEGNIGIEFSRRECNNTIAYPFLKLYDKHLDLQHRNPLFTSQYLSHINTNNLVRVEATIKGKKHLIKACGVENNSLGSIIEMPQEQKKSAFAYAMHKHMPENNHVNIKKEAKGLSPSDWAFYDMFQAMRERGINIAEFIDTHVEQRHNCKVTRSRMRKKLYSINEILLPLKPITSLKQMILIEL
jgi:hypothetical protein